MSVLGELCKLKINNRYINESVNRFKWRWVVFKCQTKTFPTRTKYFPPSLATQLRADTTMMPSGAQQLPKLFTKAPVRSRSQRLVLPAALPQSVCQTAVSTEQPVPAQSNLPGTPPFTVHFHFLATTALSLSAPLTSPPHERHARTLRQQLP